MSHIAALIGRILISIIFILSGFGKLTNLTDTNAMIIAAGLPSGLALPVALFEILAGLALVFGVMTRLVAILLAGFTLLSALFFHNDLTDPNQQVHALKNLAIAGGLLCLFAQSQMRWSYDSMRLHRRAELTERDMAERVHEAELRAARAEGRAEAPAIGRGATITASDSLTTPRRRRWF